MTGQADNFSLLPPPPSVPIHTFILSGIKMLWMTFVTENPLVWSFVQGRAHPRADVIGPLYVIGAPDVNFAPGKAILASTKDLKNGPAFLFSGKILGPNGEPVAATLDMWQADTSGSYALASYRNRGKVTTDPETGKFELLTVPPAPYGITSSILRAAHIHAIISAPGCKSLITQFYLAPKNDPSPVDKDFLNWSRSKRVDNMLHCWAIPTDKGDTFWDLPRLGESDAENTGAVAKWNSYLESYGLKVSCGASDVIKLNRA